MQDSESELDSHFRIYSSPALKDSNSGSDSCKSIFKGLGLGLESNVTRLRLGLESTNVGLYPSPTIIINVVTLSPVLISPLIAISSHG